MALFGLFGKTKKENLNKGLEKTKESVFKKLARVVVGKSKVDDEVLDNLEEVLITSDVGVETTVRIIERIEERVQRDKYMGVDELNRVLKEEIVASVEVLEIFKISKVGTVAGCVVREGRLQRSTPIRVIRDGIVIYTGKLGSLKRFKDDVKEVTNGQDCGLNIESFNDIRVGDIVEGYEQVEVKRK